jgi:hypothetical protein
MGCAQPHEDNDKGRQLRQENGKRLVLATGGSKQREALHKSLPLFVCKNNYYLFL